MMQRFRRLSGLAYQRTLQNGVPGSLVTLGCLAGRIVRAAERASPPKSPIFFFEVPC
jgi:hypothetical protein